MKGEREGESGRVGGWRKREQVLWASEKVWKGLYGLDVEGGSSERGY